VFIRNALSSHKEREREREREELDLTDVPANIEKLCGSHILSPAKRLSTPNATTGNPF
jgi:hypothetical protein